MYYAVIQCITMYYKKGNLEPQKNTRSTNTAHAYNNNNNNNNK